MANNFNQSISETTRDFENICKPVLRKMLTGNFMSIEGVSSDEHKRMLDIKSGIDAWHYNENGVRGIASRIQYGDSFDTYTVRYKRDSGTTTEYEKRIKAIKNDYLYPYYTMQAYIKNNNLLSMAICKTKYLYKLINEGKFFERRTGKNQIGGAIFYCIKWSDFDKSNIRIYNGTFN